MKRSVRLPLLALLATAAGLLGTGTAGATGSTVDAGSCALGSICAWTQPDFGGTKVSVPTGDGVACRPVGTLGVSELRSAVDRHEYYVLRLFSDTACATATSPAYVNAGQGSAASISPAARSVRLLAIPG